jgi:hypothetical protein
MQTKNPYYSPDSVVDGQCDQILRIFAQRKIVYFGQWFENYGSTYVAHISGLLFSTIPGMY